jgi:hypothetical protein
LYAQALYNNFSECRVTTLTRRANRSLLNWAISIIKVLLRKLFSLNAFS